MPTVNNMLGGTYSLYKSAYKNGTLFSSNNGLIGSNASGNRAQNSIASLWNNYGSFQSNAASSLSGLSEIRGNVSSLVESYDSTKNTFYNEFDDTMDELSKAAANIKDYNFDVRQYDENGEAIPLITTNKTVGEDGKITETTTRTKELDAAVKAVSDFAKKYNNAIDFFADNNDVSKRVGRMQTVFADTTYRKANYEAIGLNIGTDGRITVDEDKLANAIANDPNRVANALGRDGLSGKAESHIATANGQRSQLFPSAQTLIGKDLSAASLYTGNAYRSMSAYANLGNLVNMMF